MGLGTLGSNLRRYAFTLRRSAALLATGPLTPGGRASLQGVSNALGWSAHPARLPEIEPSEILPAARPVEVREVEAWSHNVVVFELCLLNALVRRLRPEAIFEFGTFDGRTTVNLLASAPPDAHAYTLNLPSEAVDFGIPNFRIGGRFADGPFAGRITQLYGDTRTFGYQPYLGQMDFIFIDAGHSHALVTSDSDVAVKLLRPAGGVIVWHDYSSIPEVTRAVDDLHAAGRLPGRMVHVRGTGLAMSLPETLPEFEDRIAGAEQAGVPVSTRPANG